MTVTIAIEKFHPFTVVYPDLEVIPAGSELFIQFPPVRLDFGPAMPGLIDQHVVSDYPLWGVSVTLPEDKSLAELAKFVISADMRKYLEEAWQICQDEVAKTPLAKKAPDLLAYIALLNSIA